MLEFEFEQRAIQLGAAFTHGRRGVARVASVALSQLVEDEERLAALLADPTKHFTPRTHF